MCQIFVESGYYNHFGSDADYYAALCFLAVCRVALGNFIKSASNELVFDFVKTYPVSGTGAWRFGHQSYQRSRFVDCNELQEWSRG